MKRFNYRGSWGQNRVGNAELSPHKAFMRTRIRENDRKLSS